jgi:NPCBM-associated, NEW3 domain of alpha-galactosidase
MKKTIARVVLGLVALAFCIFFPGVNWPGGHSSAASVPSSASKGETITGELEVIAECEDEDGRILYYIKTDKERLKVHFKSEPKQELKTGMQVTIRGSRGADAFDVEADSLQSTSTTATSSTSGTTTQSIASGTFGEIKVLVLLVNFQNDTRTPYTVDQANNLMFNQANSSSVTNYYREASYGQTWLTGDSVGVFTLPMDGGVNACNYTSQLASLAKQAATNAGVVLSNYNKFMYVFPGAGCSWSGQAYLSGSDAWINGSMILRTMAHELGHTVGLYHAHAMNCSDIISTNCVTSEYGHSSDIEGQTGVTGNFHPYQKERLGWLNYGSSPPITTVQGAGRYTISGLSVQDWNPKALKIAKDSSTWYYVEFRRPVGFDSFVSNNSATMNGVLITRDSQTNGDGNYLLDMVPSTGSWSDAALTVGKSFSDTSIGLTITVVSVSSSGAVIDVNYGVVPCIMANPMITVSPATTMIVGPGSSANYTMTLTNNNSSSCTANSFDVQPAVPSGWTALSSAPVVTVAPGSSVSSNVEISVPVSQVGGLYTASIGAVNSQSSGYGVSANRDLSVLSSLLVRAAAAQASYTLNQTISVTATVSANGSPVAGAAVNFVLQKADGSTVAGSATTSSNGSAVFTYRLNKRKDPVGIYSANVSAGLNGVSGSGLTSFQVQ